MAELAGIQWLWMSLIGLGVGIVSGGFGVGSGIILVPALVYALAADQKTAQGMSLIVMVPMVLMSAIRYSFNPAVKMSFWIFLVLAITGVIGANIGSSIAFALPSEMLRKGFAVFIIAAGIVMLWK
jgi:uncharacterized protein